MCSTGYRLGPSALPARFGKRRAGWEKDGRTHGKVEKKKKRGSKGGIKSGRHCFQVRNSGATVAEARDLQRLLTWTLSW